MDYYVSDKVNNATCCMIMCMCVLFERPGASLKHSSVCVYIYSYRVEHIRHISVPPTLTMYIIWITIKDNMYIPLIQLIGTGIS